MLRSPLKINQYFIKAALAMITLWMKQASGQCITINDLNYVVNLEHVQASSYLQSRGFTALKPLTAAGRTISQFSRKGKGYSEHLVKNEWLDADKHLHYSVHYDVKPQSYVQTFMQPLKQLGFTLKEETKDGGKHVWLYENDRYLLSIYTFTPKGLAASIELTSK